MSAELQKINDLLNDLSNDVAECRANFKALKAYARNLAGQQFTSRLLHEAAQNLRDHAKALVALANNVLSNVDSPASSSVQDSPDLAADSIASDHSIGDDSKIGKHQANTP